MVLIIRNNRIQSRRHSKIKQFWSCFVNDYNRQNSNSFEVVQKSSDVGDNMYEERRENVRQLRVLGLLFLYSTAMFTLPFAAFFGSRHILNTEFHTDKFTTNCISALAAVVTVNLIIASYAYRALFEPEPATGETISDSRSEVDNRPMSKSDLNLKED